MNLTAEEAAALDDFATTAHHPPAPTVEAALHELGVDPVDYTAALAAEGDFADYLVAVGLQDLHLAGALEDGAELVAIARQFWPLLADVIHSN